MANKSRKTGPRPRQKQSNKWSRSTTINFALGVVVALSMVLGSIFAFAAPQASAPGVTPPATFVFEPFTPTPGGPTFTPTPSGATMIAPTPTP